ncbi:MAG: class I SAM-dependent methyltransferase [Alphaproteobacteria bacterium]|nr:class I SAM-dependent methyltransferase [Alphaproteobacteria bacterium]MBV9375276.1 class I SAM-dependent methyltransferase [Alphaproteobacteria bacterium]
MAKVGRYEVPEDWPVTGESGRAFSERLRNGFFSTYLAGEVTIDVGYRGASADAVPVLPHALGVDLDYPGYDGKKLPFLDGSIDTVYSSHMLEHVDDFRTTIRDWYRVVRPGGFIVCVVPHQFLYEKRRSLPSSWNADHKRFYTPASLLRELEASLQPNTYRVRHLRDNDEGYTYEIGPETHSGGGYEIELVIQKITPPEWDLAGPPDPVQDDLERAQGEISRLKAERETLSRECARWFDAAILAKAEEVFQLPRSRRARPLAGLFPASRSPTAAALADRARDSDQWERAARFYLDAIARNPAAPELWLQLGGALQAAGKSPEAEFAYRRARALRGD